MNAEEKSIRTILQPHVYSVWWMEARRHKSIPLILKRQQRSISSLFFVACAVIYLLSLLKQIMNLLQWIPFWLFTSVLHHKVYESRWIYGLCTLTKQKLWAKDSIKRAMIAELTSYTFAYTHTPNIVAVQVYAGRTTHNTGRFLPSRPSKPIL